MRDFQRRIRRGHTHHFAFDPTQPLVVAMFAPDFGQQLHADADAEKRHAAFQHRILQRLDHAGNGGKAPHAIGESADAGQHDALGARDAVRIGGDDDLVPRAAIAGSARQRLLGGTQIPRAVIDKGDGGSHRFPG